MSNQMHFSGPNHNLYENPKEI